MAVVKNLFTKYINVASARNEMIVTPLTKLGGAITHWTSHDMIWRQILGANWNSERIASMKMITPMATERRWVNARLARRAASRKTEEKVTIPMMIVVAKTNMIVLRAAKGICA